LIALLPSRLTLQMTPQRWQQVKAILADALEDEQLEPRSGFVQRACAGDQLLKEEVDALLAHADDADELLTQLFRLRE